MGEHEACGSHTSSKAELLNHGSFSPAAGGCYSCDPSGRPATTNYHIISSNNGNFTSLDNFFILRDTPFCLVSKIIVCLST